jgi:hypothetical protein
VPASGSSSPISTRTCHRARHSALFVLPCCALGRPHQRRLSRPVLAEQRHTRRRVQPDAHACARRRVRACACVRAWQAGEGVPSNSGVVDSAPSLQYPKLTSVVCGTHSVVQHSTNDSAHSRTHFGYHRGSNAVRLSQQRESASSHHGGAGQLRSGQREHAAKLDEFQRRISWYVCVARMGRSGNGPKWE